MGGSGESVEIMSVMKPLHYLCKVLGLASFYLCEKRKTTGNIFLQSEVWWPCLWAVIYAVNLCLEIRDTVLLNETPGKIKAVYLLYYLSLHVTNIISLCVCSIFKRRQIPKIVHQIEELGNIFMIKVDRNVMYNRMRKFVMFETVLQLFYTVVNISYVCVYIMYNSSTLTCLMPSLESLGCTFNSLMILQFVSLIMISRHICKCINHELDVCCDMIENSSRYSIIRVFHIDGVSIFRSLEVKLFGYLRDHIRGLRLVYSRLNRVTRLVNAYYVLPILLGISWSFMSVVSVLYATLYYFIYVSYTDNSFIRNANISVSVSLFILCIILMALLTTACHIMGSETQMTLFHIQKIFLHRDLGKQTENELKKFCSRVIHLKLEISACGLFKLNLPFLNSFTSKFFAYFIIMFQLN
jgi:hypothetical protein